MTDKTDTSREQIEQHIKVILTIENRLNAGDRIALSSPINGFTQLAGIVHALLDERDMLAKALSALAEETLINAVADLDPDILAIADERDAAIARAKKAEDALEAAHIEGCRMGLEAAAKHTDINIEPPCECIIKWDADIKSEWYFNCWCKDITSIRASEIWCQCKNKADRIRALDPAQIVKEHGK